MTEALIIDAADLAERRALRAYDAVHLAAARAAGAAVFITADLEQFRASSAENPIAFDPTTHRTEP